MVEVTADIDGWRFGWQGGRWLEKLSRKCDSAKSQSVHLADHALKSQVRQTTPCEESPSDNLTTTNSTRGTHTPVAWTFQK